MTATTTEHPGQTVGHPEGEPRDPSNRQARRGGPTVGNRAVRHTKWIVLAPVFARVLGLGATMVLARLLSPSEFGLMAYAGTTLTFFAVFQDLGITKTLIADPGEIRGKLRAALLMSVSSGALFYVVLASISSTVAGFFDEPLLGPVLMTMGLVVVLQTSGQVHHALLIRAESYRALFWITLAQAATYLTLATTLAVAGLGVWALVLGHVAAQLTRTTLLWLVSGWRPWTDAQGSLFSGDLLRFGGALTLLSILDFVGDAWVFLSVGKVLGAASLGLYNVSFEAARISCFGLPALASSIALTSYASLLDDPDELRRLMLKGLRVVHAVVFPLSAGIVVLAPWIVPVVWGSKWLDAAPVLAVLALMGFVSPLPQIVVPYFVSSGRVHVLLRLSAVRLVAYLLLISWAVRSENLVLIASAQVCLMLLLASVLGIITLRQVGARAADLGPAVLWPLLRAAACGLSAFAVARGLDGLPPWAVLAPAVATGGAVYGTLLFLTDRKAFLEATSVVARSFGVARVRR